MLVFQMALRIRSFNLMTCDFFSINILGTNLNAGCNAYYIPLSRIDFVFTASLIE